MQILFVGHEATLTGAPLLLTELLRWLKTNRDVRFQCCLLSGGNTLHLLRNISKVVVRSTPTSPLFWQLFEQRCLFPLQLRSLQKPDVIYVNTVAAIPLLRQVQRVFGSNVPIVIHVHELNWIIRKYVQDFAIDQELSEATVVAASDSVRQALLDECGVEPANVHVIHEWLCRSLPASESKSHERRQTRTELGLRDEDRICLSVGAINWRKGTDLLSQIASKCQLSDSNLHFVWVGKQNDGYTKLQLMIDAERLGVGKHLHFVDETDDPDLWFGAADLFALTSREDPYPLAMLEAATHKLPITAFDGSGGAAEFLAEGRGKLVPYLDVDGFAAAILSYEKDRAFAQTVVDKAYEHAVTNHTLDVAGPKIFSILEDALRHA